MTHRHTRIRSIMACTDFRPNALTQSRVQQKNFDKSPTLQEGELLWDGMKKRIIESIGSS
jgi:hypothetical protein